VGTIFTNPTQFRQTWFIERLLLNYDCRPVDGLTNDGKLASVFNEIHFVK
jgi:hypothetical protein